MNANRAEMIQISALGAATVAVMTNMIVMTSCDLLQYDEGSLGVMNYIDEKTGECSPFLALEDQSLKAAGTASLTAFAVGISLLALIVINNFFWPVPYNTTLISLCGVGVQLCLLMVYTAMNNSICELEGCSWGSATVWLIITQLVYLTASVGSLYTDETVTLKQYSGFRRTQKKCQNPFRRRRGRRTELELGLGSAH